jgi:hypothetical protein
VHTEPDHPAQGPYGVRAGQNVRNKGAENAAQTLLAAADRLARSSYRPSLPTLEPVTIDCVEEQSGGWLRDEARGPARGKARRVQA